MSVLSLANELTIAIHHFHSFNSTFRSSDDRETYESRARITRGGRGRRDRQQLVRLMSSKGGHRSKTRKESVSTSTSIQIGFNNDNFFQGPPKLIDASVNSSSDVSSVRSKSHVNGTAQQFYFCKWFQFSRNSKREVNCVYS